MGASKQGFGLGLEEYVIRVGLEHYEPELYNLYNLGIGIDPRGQATAINQ